MTHRETHTYTHLTKHAHTEHIVLKLNITCECYRLISHWLQVTVFWLLFILLRFNKYCHNGKCHVMVIRREHDRVLLWKNKHNMQDSKINWPLTFNYQHKLCFCLATNSGWSSETYLRYSELFCFTFFCLNIFAQELLVFSVFTLYRYMGHLTIFDRRVLDWTDFTMKMKKLCVQL